jgi:hypothetical protein
MDSIHCGNGEDWGKLENNFVRTSCQDLYAALPLREAEFRVLRFYDATIDHHPIVCRLEVAPLNSE